MVIEDAKRTHPTLVQHGSRHASECYVDPLLVYAMEERPLPEPDGDPVRICIGDGLAVFRRDVERFAPGELDPDRLADLVVAANEAAANSLTHGGGHGDARMWWNDSSVVVELRDRGVIHDPLVGRIAPGPAAGDRPRRLAHEPALRPRRGPLGGRRNDRPPPRRARLDPRDRAF